MTEILQTIRVLVIDDEKDIGTGCKRVLEKEGMEVLACSDPAEGLDAALSGTFDVLLVDMMMPGTDGLTILKTVKSAGILSEVVMITGFATIETAVEAMRQGAVDYLPKPFNPDQLRIVVRRVVERSVLIQENESLRRELEQHRGFAGFVGDSREMESTFSKIKKYAPTDGTVLVTGESGTGKELAARALHESSPRRKKPFLACDCSTLTASLLESELFGHVKGAFTGATSMKRGLFELADRGTLFLDEIGNINADTQGKLLRVLETKQVKKVGDETEKAVDIRLIAATNKDLKKLAREGVFREDLYFRLNVLPLELPPLRERKGDTIRLASHFLEEYREKHGSVQAARFSPEAFSLLDQYSWPGNVRELKNIVERTALLCDKEIIEPVHLPDEFREYHPRFQASELPQSWEEFKEIKRKVREEATQELERQFLQQALRRAEFNVTKASKQVGMQRSNFHALMSKYGILPVEENEDA